MLSGGPVSTQGLSGIPPLSAKETREQQGLDASWLSTQTAFTRQAEEWLLLTQAREKKTHTTWINGIQKWQQFWLTIKY